MTFESTDAIKQYLLSHMQPAIQKAEEQVYQIINRFVKEYYAEYSPEVYERTYQLYRSLVKSDIVSTGNGFEVQIYFDASQLDYQIKKMTKIHTTGGFMNPYNHAVSSSGIFSNPEGSAEKTLEAAMHGTHGGKAAGTAIWDESISILNKEAYEILKRMLISEGIPIY